MPNLSDIVWKDGYLWGVFEGTRIYRMNPVTGAVDSFPLTGIETGEAFGAQWLYGNGNLGISNNVSGNIYQIDVADPTAATPTFTTLSRIRGPGSLNNDGASDPGLPANLRVEKDAPATFVAGGRVAYSITVHNDGPGVSSGWVVTDTIPAGLTDVTAVAPACTIAAGVITCSGPSLGVGQAATVTFSGATPNPGLPPPDGCITNTADVVGNEPEPIPDPGSNTSTATTCPGLVGVRSFAVQKNVSPAVAHPGDLVTYRITVQNTGSEAFVDPDLASFTDDLTGVVDDATFDLASITGGASYDDSTSVLSWSGPLAVGQLAVISYQVRVNPTPLDYSLVNVVVPGPDGECIADAQCGTTIPVAAFRVVKVALTAPPVFPGQRVDYQITVENLGQFAYTTETPASFTEDLTDVLGDAALDEASITGGATYAAPDLSWSGALPVGPTPVTITYAATVKNPDTGDKTMVNTVVTPPDSGGNCPAGSIDPDCAATVPIMNYTVAKASTVDQSNPAAIVVRYAITVTNNGVTAYSAEQPATFTDDLSAVLDDATYNDDASAGSYAAPKLSWSGALAAGASVTVTYSVTVEQPRPRRPSPAQRRRPGPDVGWRLHHRQGIHHLPPHPHAATARPYRRRRTSRLPRRQRTTHCHWRRTRLHRVLPWVRPCCWPPS